MEVYVDDMVVKSESTTVYQANLLEIFQQLRKYNMCLNLEKCAFGVQGGRLLGFVLTQRGIEANPEKCQAIIQMKSPTTIKEVQQLTERLATLSRFLPTAAAKSYHFFNSPRKNKNFTWTNECEQAFTNFKNILASPPILHKPTNVDQSLEVLLNRNITSSSFKTKSDYVTEPISTTGLEGLCKMLVLEESQFMILTPYDGIMSEILESATPFPHKKGMLYGIQYSVSWNSNEDATKYIKWIRTLYDYLAPYVSKLARRAYLNYRDLDLDVNGLNTSYVKAQSWGLKYFNQNFKRLVESEG
ncbi:berberine bridge enzyme-like 27 [Arachis ipaensis]|uniref:berberine bridge enzyme-like 27 n=1 Tax=Arachis ipaensis TaxID=130454 RepID=UPI0007AFA0D1|nr:berberine bridge enzyme-like 27 [Arachis ipaensis]